MIRLERWPGQRERAPRVERMAAQPGSSILEVLERILDRGLVIDGSELVDGVGRHAQRSLSLLGIPLIRAKARWVVHAAAPGGVQVDQVDQGDRAEPVALRPRAA